MNDIKNIFFLCFMYYIATGHLMDGEAVETKTDTLKIDELETDKLKRDGIEKWSNTLKLVHVVEWGSLYSTPFSSYKNYIVKVLGNRGWPTHIVNGLADKFIETNWPPGISAFDKRESNQELMDSYNCRRLPSTTISKEVVIVFASDNKTMPNYMIDELGFVMFFESGAIIDIIEDVETKTDTPKIDELETDKLKSDEIEKWSNTLNLVKVLNWGCIYFDPPSSYKYYIVKVLKYSGWPSHIVNGLAEKYNQSHWPLGISSYYGRISKRDLMASYSCRRLPRRRNALEGVIVFASDNKTMPQEMIDEFGFVMFFESGAIIDI